MVFLSALTKLTNGRPMKFERHLFTDHIQNKPVNLYEDQMGRLWMANNKWGWFRIPYESRWDEPPPPATTFALPKRPVGLYAPRGTETGTDFNYKKYADTRCPECEGWGEFHVPYDDYDTYIIHRCDCTRDDE